MIKHTRLIIFSLSIFVAAAAVTGDVCAFPAQKNIVNNILPEYYDSFSNSLGNAVQVFSLEELATYDGKGYQKMSKGGWWYYPPYNYMALEGVPGLDWISGYRADWFFEMKKDSTRMSFMISNLWKNWTQKKVTHFSPFTFSKVQLPGLKFNISSRQYEFTGIYSWVNPKEPRGDASPEGQELIVTRTRGLSVIGGEAGLKKFSIPDFMNINIGMNFAKVYYESPYLNQGSSTSLVVYGPAFDGEIKGIKIKGEYAVSRRDLGTSTTSAYAVYIEAKKLLMDNNLTIGGETYTLQPDYMTTFETPEGRFNLVDDNDDADKWVDNNTDGQMAGWLDSTYPADKWMWNPINTNGLPLTMFFSLYDRDGDGTYDWEQPGIFYTADPPAMWEGQDRNNNWVSDRYEDDNLPDYKYSEYSLRKDLRGTNLFLTYKLKDLASWTSIDTEGNAYWLLSGLEVTGGSLLENKISDSSNQYSNVKYFRANFSQRFEKSAQISMDYETKRVKDTFANDLVSYGVFGGADKLDFQDSVYNTMSMNLNLMPIRNLKIENKMLSRLNNKLDANTVKSVQGMTTRFDYNFKLPEAVWDPLGFIERVTLEPKYKYLTTTSYDNGAYTDTYGNNLMLSARYEPFEGFVLRGGRNYLWLRNSDKTKESDGDLLAYEISMKTNASGYNYIFYAGYNKYNSVLPATKGILRDEDLYFVKIFVR